MAKRTVGEVNEQIVTGIHDRLAGVMAERQLSRLALHERSGVDRASRVSRDFINRLMRKERGLSLETLAKLCTAADMTLPEFLSWRPGGQR